VDAVTIIAVNENSESERKKEGYEMSFGFTAIGSKQDVIQQLEAHAASQYITGTAGEDLIRLLITHICDDSPAQWANGHEFRYVVKAGGHSGGGSPLSLNLTVEAQSVPISRPVS
jgi:hypothetical protein